MFYCRTSRIPGPGYMWSLAEGQPGSKRLVLLAHVSAEKDWKWPGDEARPMHKDSLSRTHSLTPSVPWPLCHGGADSPKVTDRHRY